MISDSHSPAPPLLCAQSCRPCVGCCPTVRLGNDSPASICHALDELHTCFLSTIAFFHRKDRQNTALSLLKHMHLQMSFFQQGPRRFGKQNQLFLSCIHSGHQRISIVLSRFNTWQSDHWNLQGRDCVYNERKMDYSKLQPLAVSTRIQYVNWNMRQL